jgi:hypothetical protein
MFVVMEFHSSVLSEMLPFETKRLQKLYYFIYCPHAISLLPNACQTLFVHVKMYQSGQQTLSDGRPARAVLQWTALDI